jgi:GNAT superfamily N-acetyltransferase
MRLDTADSTSPHCRSILGAWNGGRKKNKGIYDVRAEHEQKMNDTRQWTTELKRADRLNASKRNIRETWFCEEFGQVLPFQFAEPDWYLLANIEKDLVGGIGILKRTILVNGEKWDVGGISGVIVRKAWRGRGISKRMTKEASDFIRGQLKADFGLLFCWHELIPLYQECGWNLIRTKTIFSQSTGKLTHPRDFLMMQELSGKKWSRGEVDLNGLPW